MHRCTLLPREHNATIRNGRKYSAHKIIQYPDTRQALKRPKSPFVELPRNPKTPKSHLDELPGHSKKQDTQIQDLQYADARAATRVEEQVEALVAGDVRIPREDFRPLLWPEGVTSQI